MMKIYTGWFLFIATQLGVSVKVHPMYELELSNYQVVHKRTYNGHHAGLAIDKNTATYSIACGNCNDVYDEGPAWWIIDLQKSEPISKVVLISSQDLFTDMGKAVCSSQPEQKMPL
ncbi:hypothetical protein HELRODRAFT_172588 [Helobdella robusta]|uniref:Fucolectin tachylectin-4 pentraxin-1 domain-containing protein n=1 Tax=Helobdella robusta TaxID=6412 RepID=T1F5K2_HELRO|nr:hypothetical protein HELRODRAFT_172588 [Helobdella robusta]ESO04232.1 hypothetical protein HELRODRAFT_172588 [Helobdella robusta]